VNVRQLRAAAAVAHPGAIPNGAGRSQPFKATELRARKVDRNGVEMYQLDGLATAYEQPYEMYDMFGPYKEIVSGGAGARSLAADPEVAFLVNHAGVTMARTTAKTLELSEAPEGLVTRAFLNPKRSDVKDLVMAVDDKAITEMSFAFMITRGRWSPDYTEYRIDEYDIDRGDVSAVNYGANPHTNIAARSAEVLAHLRALPDGARRAAFEALRGEFEGGRETTSFADISRGERTFISPTGRSTAILAALLD
jgi:HK97 family phage prohead protease